MNEIDLSYATEEMRKAVAHVLEAPSSPLCDCSVDVNPATTRDGRRLYHHCDCRAVVSAAIVLGGPGKTLHERMCGCKAVMD